MQEQSLFIEALDKQDLADRVAFLDRECAGNPMLRARIERLLARHDQASPVPDSAPVGTTATADQGLAEQLGAVIGPYKLIEQIGEGGMGTVWMAQQTEPVKRLVAVKLIKAGMDSKQVIARFEAERQALALMDHSNIARVLDAGTTDAGRPYFVMDLVKGVPITKYCDEHHLTPRQRLELFIPVCRAVQHAHQKGIIHRDLKPSNVLVALDDGRPIPKVIDFGVAKATGQRLTEKTLVTGFGSIVGTLEYMSPEQAEINQLDIDTRSDIYSLGVLLYELLTGTTPLNKDQLRRVGYDELRRIIREEEPPRPSTRISTLGADAVTLCASRGSEPRKLSALVRGELDWIVMKSLEKDRNRRYETAAAVVADVQRYLSDEPVLACPPSAGYRLRKFARRNMAGLAFSGLILLILLAVTGGVGWNVRDRAARQSAVEQEAMLALQEAERWQGQGKWPEALSAAKRAEGLLAGSGSDELRDRVRRLRKDLEMVLRLEVIPLLRDEMKEDSLDYEAADQAYAKAFTDYGIDVLGLPLEEAAAKIRARSNVASVLVAALDDWAFDRLQNDRAGGLALRAVAQAAEQDPWRRQVQEAVTGKDTQALAALTASPDLFRQPPISIVALERGMLFVDLKPALIKLLRRAQRQYPGDFWINHDLARVLTEMGDAYRDEAVSFQRAAVAIRPQSSEAHNLLGLALKAQGKQDEAAEAYRKAIELDPKYSRPHVNLGDYFRQQEKLDDAVAAYLKAIEIDPNYAIAYGRLGTAFQEQGKPEAAIAAVRKAIEFDRKQARFRNELGAILCDVKHDYDGAIAEFRKAIELDPKHANAHHNLGLALKQLGKPDEAIAAYRKAIELDPKNAKFRSDLGGILCDVKHDYDGAIAEFRKAIELDPNYADAHHNLGLALKQLGKQDEAIAAYRKAIEFNPKNAKVRSDLGGILCDVKHDYDGAVAEFRKAIEFDPNYADAHHNLGVVLNHQKKHPEAVDALRKAIAIDPTHIYAYFQLGVALKAQGKLDEAIGAFRKAIEIDPKFSAAHHTLGIVLCDCKHDYEGAADCFNEVIELDPENAVARHNLGNARLWQKRWREAIAAYLKAIELDPKYARAYADLGVALKAQGKLQEAIAHFDKAIELDSKYAKVHHDLGNALSNQQKLPEAVAAYRKAIELDPEYAPALNGLAWALATCAEPKLRDPAQAVSLATKAVELAPQLGTYRNTLGVAHYRAGNWIETLAALQKSMELGKGGDSSDRCFLAMAHWKLGNKDEARKWYDQAVAWMEKHQPNDEESLRFRADAAELLGLAGKVAPPPREKK